MAMNGNLEREVRFDIVERIGVISIHSTGWRKELNLVSWNEGAPKYDIRDWSPDHERMSRGVTLHENEMRQIFDLMRKRRMGNRNRRGDLREERQNVTLENIGENEPEGTSVNSPSEYLSVAEAASPPVIPQQEAAPSSASPQDALDDFDDLEINEDGEVLSV